MLCVSVYLGFIAYLNISQLGLFFSSLTLIAVINSVFIAWSFKMLIHGYSFSLKNNFENLQMSLVKVKFCGRYFFTRKMRLFYIRKRWMRSVLERLRMANVINAWTGKLKGSKENIIKVLKGHTVSVDDRSKL